MSLSVDAIAALAEDLLRIESPIGHERALADWVEARARSWDPHALIRAGDSLCIVPRAPRPGSHTLLLVGHLDTVPALSANPVRREGDRLFGLGASDMKVADAVILGVLERACATPARHDLVGVLYAREEGPFVESEMPRILEAARPWFERSTLAICMEPTDNRIEMGALGTCHARVTISGKRAHSARPWQGENAIHKLAPLLERLSHLPREAHTYHGLTFYETISATGVEFRGARNVVPDRAVLNLNYRFAPDKDEAAVRARLTDLLGPDAAWDLTDFCPAGRVCGDNPLLAELKARLDPVEVAAKQAWTDVGRLSQEGLDAINWGPGLTAQAHQDGEYASLAQLARTVAVLERWLF